MSEQAPEELLIAIDIIDKDISLLHRQVGAPGDFGYNTPVGKALFALYKFQHELRQLKGELNHE